MARERGDNPADRVDPLLRLLDAVALVRAVRPLELPLLEVEALVGDPRNERPVEDHVALTVAVELLEQVSERVQQPCRLAQNLRGVRREYALILPVQPAEVVAGELRERVIDRVPSRRVPAG